MFDVKKWYDELKTSNPDAAALVPYDDLLEGTLMKSDYTRKSQEVARQRAEVDQRFAQLEPFEVYLQGLESQWGVPREQWSQAQFQIAHRNDPTPAAPQFNPNQFAAQLQNGFDTKLAQLKQEFDQEIQRTRAGAAILIDFLPEAREQWNTQFKSHGAFPKDDFQKQIAEGGALHGMPLTAAWQLYTQPYAEKNKDAEIEQRIAKAAEDAYRKGRSEAGNLEPDPSGTSHVSVLDTLARTALTAKPGEQAPSGPSEAEIRANFSKAYTTALQAAQGGAPHTAS